MMFVPKPDLAEKQVAQDGLGRPPTASIPYADRDQIVYRSCLVRWAKYLRTSRADDTDQYLANVADLNCASERDAFTKSMEKEVRLVPGKLSADDMAQMTQAAHNEILAWIEGFIFSERGEAEAVMVEDRR